MSNTSKSKISVLNFQPVLFIIGVLFIILSAFMLVPLLADFLYGSKEDLKIFAFCAALSLTIGAILVVTQNQSKFAKLNVRQAFLVTAMSWISLAFAASIPLYMSPILNLSFADALFEATSGLTTTGSTILENLENTPVGILMWRSVLQWLGGIGIVVTALVILPMLQVGGMQLFRVEFADTMERSLPRPAQIGLAIVMIYSAFTLLCALLYWAGGMSLFDAINHSMTTVSTGGYSTHDESLGWFQNPVIKVTAILFMILGSLPFLLFSEAVRGNIRKLFLDSQVQVFLALLLCGGALIFFNLRLTGIDDSSLIDVVFNVTSVFTGTGYSTRDYSSWGSFAVILFFFMMLIGGCSGSTTCGLKIFRLQVLYAAAKVQIFRLTRPNGVFIMSYQGRSLSEDIVQSVMGFFFLYVFSFAVLSILLGSTGLDFITSVSASATAIANVGPGLGSSVGPSGNFGSLSSGAKWIMSAGMIIGRLELFTIYVLFSLQFWRK